MANIEKKAWQGENMQMLLDSLEYNKTINWTSNFKAKNCDESTGDFNFRFKFASPKFIVYYIRNCPKTNLSSAAQIPVVHVTTF